MNFEKRMYLTFSKEIDGSKLSMEEMVYWSNHNVFAFINYKCTVAHNNLKLI